MKSAKSRACSPTRPTLLAGAGVLALALHGASALAAETAASASGRDSSFNSGDIIVTAQKREEALEKVPISISAISSETLKTSSIQMVRDLPQAVPALRVNYAGTFVLPTIRGVGSIVALPGLVQNIATYVDGFYIPTPSASNFDLVNVESVNVLKGPQGTLFGANATGGAIMINTRKPKQELSGLVRAGYGSYNNLSLAGYLTGGTGGTFAADIAASYERGDGFVTNVVDGNDEVAKFEKWAVRPQFLFTFSDNFKVLLAYEHTYTNDPGTQMVVARHGISIANPLFVPGTTLVFNNPKRVSLDNPGYAIRKTDSFTMKIDADIGFADIASYTGYRKDKISQGLDYEASSAALNFSNWTVPDKTFTQEIDITSKSGGRFNWVIGGFFMTYTDDYAYFTNGAAIFTSHNKSKSYAAFAEGTYEVVDNLFLTLGGRYTHDKPCVAFDLIVVGHFMDSGCVTFNDFSMRAVARYEISPNSSVYGSFSQGYRSGGLPASGFDAHNPVKPEHIDAFEIGYKLAEGPLRLNLAAFYYNYKDIQVTSYGAGGNSQTVNAGKSHIYGVDADVTFQVTPDFDVTLSGAFTHAEYVDFPNALGRVMVTNPLDANFGQIIAINVNATNTRVERTPRFSGSISANYGLDVAGGRLNLNASLFYTGKYFFDSAHQLLNPSHELLNLRATWTDPSDRFDISFYGKNVTNSTYFRSNFLDPYAARAVYGEPVTFGGSVTYRF